jgi:O-antigen/teichoic acid export membrane protein
MVAVSSSFLRVRQASFSIADQALFVGGTFLANVMLARTQTKEEYGMFVLSYSIFTFLTGLHNASILEPYTVYGSGRYRNRISEYLRLMARSNAIVGLVLTGALLLVCLCFSLLVPHRLPRSFLGLGLTVGILLSGIFLRRAFYLEGKAMFAAGVSLTYFVTVTLGLWYAVRAHFLDGFSVFLILALGWIVAGAVFAGRLPFGKTQSTFIDLEPNYWNEHWKYARWVLVTAFVFQFTTQGYYWLVAEFLSVREVAQLRAMYLLIGPVDQLFIALSYLLLPMLALHYASKGMDKLVALWGKYLLATVGATALFAIALRVLGKPVMHILYAGKFDGLAPLLFLLALLPLLMGIGNTLSNVLNAMEKPKLVFWGYLSSGVATFLLGIPLVQHLGLRGAVYGMLASGTTFTAALGIAFVFPNHKSVRP